MKQTALELEITIEEVRCKLGLIELMASNYDHEINRISFEEGWAQSSLKDFKKRLNELDKVVDLLRKNRKHTYYVDGT